MENESGELPEVPVPDLPEVTGADLTEVFVALAFVVGAVVLSRLMVAAFTWLTGRIAGSQGMLRWETWD